MATIQSIKAKIQGLIDKSNEATGGSDTDLTTAIDNLIANQGGGGALVEKAVNFWDYDGTLLYSYTIQEAHALTELPPAPIHNELDYMTFKDWSETLATINSLPAFGDIFALYKPTDATTYGSANGSVLYVDIYSDLTITLKLSCATSGKGFVFWGDGNVEPITSTSPTNMSHTYENYGKYAIFIYSGTTSTYLGATSGSNNLMNSAEDYLLLSCALGDFHYINQYAFYKCYRLEKAYVKRGNGCQYGFNGCGNLRVCYSIAGPYMFGGCYALTRYRGSGGETTNGISNGIMATVHHTGGAVYSIPRACRTFIITYGAVSSLNSKAVVPNGMKIYVLDNLVSNYKSNSLWSTYADRIYGISEINHKDLML